MPPIKFSWSIYGNSELFDLFERYLPDEKVTVKKMNLKDRPVNTSVFEEAEVVEWLGKEQNG